MSSKYVISSDNVSTSIFFNPIYKRRVEDIILMLESNDENKVYSKKAIYKEITEYVNKKVSHTKSFCKGLNEEYITYSIDEMDAIVAIGTKGMDILPNGNIFSFALIKFNDNDNSIYIDVICSNANIKGAGDVLIRSIENISKTLYITKIKLKSVYDAITFYKRYGFSKIKSCDDVDELCEMEKIVEKKTSARSGSKASVKARSGSKARSSVKARSSSK
jgi:hypothetical protein